MMRIGICDDEKVCCDMLVQQIEECFKDIDGDYELICFSSGEEVLDYQGEQIHLLFLDIELKGVDGIQLMKRLAHDSRVLRIVFTSSHQELVFDAFSTKTIGFLSKPIKNTGVLKFIQKVRAELDNNRIITFVSGKQTIYKGINDVICLEGEKNYTYLYSADAEGDRILVSGSLKYWQEQLNHSSVVRIHKSYLINHQHVQQWDNGYVHMDNGMRLKIGRAYLKQATDSFHRYLQEIARNRIG
ncbi:MAG: LytTR family DNA-binding domain-containing protein [Acetatifactor sp.]|nr:LytTR family DNA-binding domain-containing protein [Acetatifactor sp.]